MTDLLLAARPKSKQKLAGHMFHDMARGVIIGPFESSDQALKFALDQGHQIEDIIVALWTNPSNWAETGRM